MDDRRGIVTLTRDWTVIAEELRKCQENGGFFLPLCCRLNSRDLVPDEESSTAFLFVGVRS